jgi:hypothetical protein
VKTETETGNSRRRTKTETTGIGAIAETSNRTGVEITETNNEVRDKMTKKKSSRRTGDVLETIEVKIGTGPEAETADLEEEEILAETGETEETEALAETAEEIGITHPGETVGKITDEIIGETTGETDLALRISQPVGTDNSDAETGGLQGVSAETEVGGDLSQVKEVGCNQELTAVPRTIHVTLNTA